MPVQLQLLALAGTFAIAAVITPLFRALAIRFGLVDAPDTSRKLHSGPVALCGGPVVLVSVMLSSLFAAAFVPSLLEVGAQRILAAGGLIIACVAIVAIGMADDRWQLGGRPKLAGQVLVASFLVATGYRFESVSMFGVHVDLQWVAVPISIAWLLLTINSINLIDGADGLCCSVGWIACAGFAAMATLQGHWIEATFAATVAGALRGFLIYHFPPARVFLGDSGSMLIGLVLGALAIRTSLKGATAVSILGPVAILALPFFDSSMAIVRRKLTGRSIFSTDRGHLHHTLMIKGFGHSRLVLLVSLFSGVLAAAAFLSAALNSEMIAMIAVLVVLGCLVASRLFGYSELALLIARVAYMSESVWSSSRADSPRRQRHYRLQGERSWETVWDALVEFADKHDLAKVCLDLNAPWLHEGYHACWDRAKLADETRRWRMVVPLYAGDRTIGRLEFAGSLAAGASCGLLDALSMLVEAIEAEACKIAQQQAQLPPEHLLPSADSGEEVPQRAPEPEYAA